MLMVLVLALLIVSASYAQRGALEPTQESSRMLWIERFGLVLLALCSTNQWLGGLMVMATIGSIPRAQQEPILLTALMWGGLYVALSSHVTLEWIPWILGAVLAVGAIQGLYAIHSLWIGGNHLRSYRVFGYNLTLGEAHTQLMVGCGNPNHAQAISAAATAAGIGLLSMGYLFLYPCIILSALVLLHAFYRGDGHGRPTAAHAYVFALIMSLPPLASFWIGSAVVGVFAFICSALVWRCPALLSERAEIWPWLLIRCLHRKWWQHLFGYGSLSWLRSQATMRPFPVMHIQPHNDILLMLYERGWIGVGLLLGYLGTAFYTAAHAGPAGVAVFILGAVLCTCALVSSPWFPYVTVEFRVPDTNQIGVIGQGSPALNVMSFAAVICAEALR